MKGEAIDFLAKGIAEGCKFIEVIDAGSRASPFWLDIDNLGVGLQNSPA
jgi:hypothetical protein